MRGLMIDRKFLRYTLLIIGMLCMLGLSSLAVAQAVDNQGTEFILAFLPNTLGTATAEQVQLHLSSEVSTTATITYPVISPTFVTTVAVQPGSTTIVTLPVTAANAWPTNAAVGNNAVRVSAAHEVIVYLLNRRSASAEAALGLPIEALNTEYLVMTYQSAIVSLDRGLFAVVAAFDNTTVTITPTRALLGGFAAGTSFTRVLHRGQGFLGQSTTFGAAGDLTGTIISANRPVSMSNGNLCTTIPTDIPTCDHIFEVAQPTQNWGTRIPVSDLPDRPAGSIYRILAATDDTKVTRNGFVMGTLHRGQFFEDFRKGTYIFAANRPIFVAQFMTGKNSFGATVGDPAMSNMTPVEQYASHYTFSTIGDSQFAENFLTVIADAADVGTLSLDGVPIPAARFSTSVGGKVAAMVRLAPGTHTTTSRGRHGITVAGYNSSHSYLYPGGVLFPSSTTPTGDANAPLCSGTLVVGEKPAFLGTAQDDAPSEDSNGNGLLDAGEDENGNAQIDVDSGIASVQLQAGAVNLALQVAPFIPGAGVVTFTVTLVDPHLDGTGVVRVTDKFANTCQQTLTLQGIPAARVCDVDGNDMVDIKDIGLIFAARGTRVTGDDPRDVNKDGRISTRDGRLCTAQCTFPRCASTPPQ